MIGVLIVTHAPLGSAFIKVIDHIFGSEPTHLEAIDVLPNQHTDEVTQLIKAAVTRLNSGDGVLVLTDITGATPSVCCQQLSTPRDQISDQVAILAGLSLPMLLRALTYRNKPLDVVVEMAQAGARSGAIRVDTYLPMTPDFITPDS